MGGVFLRDLPHGLPAPGILSFVAPPGVERQLSLWQPRSALRSQYRWCPSDLPQHPPIPSLWCLRDRHGVRAAASVLRRSYK